MLNMSVHILKYVIWGKKKQPIIGYYLLCNKNDKMKINTKLVIFLMIMFAGQLITAQENQNKQTNNVKLPPNTFGFEALSMINSTFTMEYERSLLNNFSAYAAAGVTLKMHSYDDYSGVKGEIQTRMYFYENINKGYSIRFYFSPFFRYHYIENKYVENICDYDEDWNYTCEDVVTNKAYNIFTGGFIFGVKSYIIKKMYFDGNVGGGMKYTLDGANLPTLDLATMGINNTGVFPRINLGIGFAF
jgi:hypothetical protein